MQQKQKNDGCVAKSCCSSRERAETRCSVWSDLPLPQRLFIPHVGKSKGTIIPLPSYTGLDGESRKLTDVESRLRLNPRCIKRSSLDYPSQPLVTSARAQKWILTALSGLCVYASVCSSCGQTELRLPAALKRASLAAGEHQNIRCFSGHFWRTVCLLVILVHFSEPTLTDESVRTTPLLPGFSWMMEREQDKHHDLWVALILIN